VCAAGGLLAALLMAAGNKNEDVKKRARCLLFCVLWARGGGCWPLSHESERRFLVLFCLFVCGGLLMRADNLNNLVLCVLHYSSGAGGAADFETRRAHVVCVVCVGCDPKA
jgi:hypothetical protein